MIQCIDGKKFRDMFVSGANNLQNNKDLVDKLNVFPVPDGDTGTNMSLTISYAIKELSKVENDDITNVGKALSKGSLMGARGNSGVILSQIIRGIAKSVEGKETLNVVDLANALKNGSDTAYKAVIKPIEGTILTVVRESGEYALQIAKEDMDMIEFLELVVAKANESLNKTPELLKALKEAGVVDSGGKGLVLIYEGMLSSLKGNDIESVEGGASSNVEVNVEQNISTEDIKFQYCTEFILESNKVDDLTIRERFMKYGDSLAVVGDEGVIKVHVHTNDPGLAIQEALSYGQLLTIKIENMKLQHENKVLNETAQTKEVPVEEKEYGFIATSMGEGLAQIFKDFGVDYIIEGGQTMNPSTEDFMKAIESLNAKNIIILPNNSNIIMAANQAKELSDKNIVVIPTKNVSQAFATLVTFDADSSIEENEASMMEALSSVKSGQVTYAVRDTVINDVEVKEGNIIGIAEGKLLSAGDKVDEITTDLVEKLVDEDSAIITLFYGEDTSKEEAEALRDALEEKFEDIDVELHYGGQPLYYYLISVE
ncbi:MAG: DAK2 domain-containing protein [Clostridiales bacterium]|uniref:DAK2 domain-containing protein n=1 Tax=Terrisporobacter sp. TaxID=1965305 RepID=UPI002A503AFF|nr:DAK2 domain-containing protein [Terrisporobacter sp.]MCI5629569.1 DAK2 domain-containing protein [Clostridium sp.]MDD7755013.1 DAK2 domain-containing protein [Clostridiales bacterium]MCI6457568.1 DAK2 domain-containing protein [Clostridium sp.]MCI7205975.1 DAK2 domain-containing protein [Clostridium sp.]MDY4133828.1 DAK2 domain-containing protein [Terrisporobacter sp.]